MSIQATDNETLIGSNKPSSSFRVPNVPLHNEEEDALTATSTSRIPNISPKKKKGDDFDFAILSGIGFGTTSLSNITSIPLDERAQTPVDILTDAVKEVAAFIGNNLGTFAFGATIAAMGLKPEGLKPKKVATPDAPNKLAKTIVEEGTEAAAKPVARAIVEEGTEAAARPVARIIAEEGAEIAARPAARIIAEEGAEIAARGIFRGLWGATKILGGFLKRVPVLGAVITGGFVAAEVGSFALQGEWSKAGAATVAGGFEMVGNIVGLGAGDALREGARAAFIAAGGEQFEDIAKSDIRAVAEMGIELAQDFNASAAAPVMAQAPTPGRGFVPAAFAA